MTDLTNITTPLGLLEPETEEALRAHGGPYEFFNASGQWIPKYHEGWQPNAVYRVVKPKPTPLIVHDWDALASHIVAAAYEDAAKVAIDYINGDLAQPEMGIWWNIMKSAQSDATAALERVRREARNEALEEALLMTELYPRPHGSRIANKIRAMMINDNDHIEEQETVLAKAVDEYPPEVVRLVQALIKLKCSDDEREYMIGHKLLSIWDYER